MARRPRLDTAGAWRHVMNRGAGRRRVFSQDSDRHIFTDLLGALDRDFGVQTHAFCLMENHYHLLLRSSSGELSAAMQHLSANFTRHVNHRRGTDGPIFRVRFHSVSVDRDEQLREVCRYVHRNPVDAGFGGRLERYRWSSLGAYLGRRPVPHFLHVDGACPPPTSPGCVAGRRRRSAPAPPERAGCCSTIRTSRTGSPRLPSGWMRGARPDPTSPQRDLQRKSCSGV